MTVSMTRQQAGARLQQVHAQLYSLNKQVEDLENEARTIAGFLQLAQREDQELKETEEAAKKAPAEPAKEAPEALNPVGEPGAETDSKDGEAVNADQPSTEKPEK